MPGRVRLVEVRGGKGGKKKDRRSSKTREAAEEDRKGEESLL